ncbi:RagB/SusD family nutrient uptake outer membrane protein [Fulvivirga sp. RKSG066]|uniref:RagB/SusD family nutrient uptake outer membrane protein n=1 Tax=Fulvivirga aurantia TaxID=2529383 RepID=UPI0012BC74CE|nr:RagB/SusD family nutrient uptake outer membrane protein [Fulvivirga aurantia]MTI22939.1 RagB/SusD family nutrient uptake outer membrane protein [Fulvivirga aurantia]
MKAIQILKNTLLVGICLLGSISCDDDLNEPLDNEALLEDVDYTRSENMFEILKGSYAELYHLQWETFPIISVRGDDVNAAGDQPPLHQTDEFLYNENAWMYNSAWQNLYGDLFVWKAAQEELLKYKEFASNPANADQYIAEINVMIGFELLQISRLWGDVLIPPTSNAEDLYNTPVSSQSEVLQYISDLMDESIPNLPNVHPNQRTDITGGITSNTARAVKAMVNLDNKNWQGVVDATDGIIGSNLYTLEPDYYNLFKIPGKLNDENILELQYSDFGNSSGENRSYLYASLGPNEWTPAVSGAQAGWGFWEPSIPYIEFMLDRDETIRLETSVLFTPDGIDELISNGNTDLPGFVTNVTRDGDQFDNSARLNFGSGKHYLPSVQLSPGQTIYGRNKNFIVIRYAEVLLMHAEAIVNGATSSTISADQAVNLVRARAGLDDLVGVTLDQVLDEKFAEFGMEWGIRYYDLVRHDLTQPLNYGGRTYDPASDKFLPYPLSQATILSQLQNN